MLSAEIDRLYIDSLDTPPVRNLRKEIADLTDPLFREFGEPLTKDRKRELVKFIKTNRPELIKHLSYQATIRIVTGTPAREYVGFALTEEKEGAFELTGFGKRAGKFEQQYGIAALVDEMEHAFKVPIQLEFHSGMCLGYCFYKAGTIDDIPVTLVLIEPDDNSNQQIINLYSRLNMHHRQTYPNMEQFRKGMTDETGIEFPISDLKKGRGYGSKRFVPMVFREGVIYIKDRMSVISTRGDGTSFVYRGPIQYPSVQFTPERVIGILAYNILPYKATGYVEAHPNRFGDKPPI
ncbi:MAG: hypothetical protein KKC75_05125 [Nanoarchaeota archaeon]|nr:hypothetical protein [Nanoarchaeota archaeon]MBU1004836.1 hypothetical protein [Nanoarchaeota archaeon]MBU1946774.1 hypothetical protein [Nanoarchaeota archaeon]